MSPLFDTLQALLRQDSRFFAEDGTLLRNAVCEAAEKLDPALLRLLLSHPDTRARFFTEAAGVLVFDKARFLWTVTSREFLPDSYTRFQNRIGLADRAGHLLSASGDTVLSFPFKDCVLEGGQTREDQRRGEVFYNETLAPQEIDQLLSPKVLFHPRRCTAAGEQPVTELLPEDNLLIQGNNLLVLSSLRRRYAGRIRMAYWDVPYNTGSDSFGYNDRFSRSTWLVFLKNRVEQTLPLLAEDGVLLIQCSFHQQAYLQVLLDELVGNHVMTFHVLVRHPDRTLAADKAFNDVIEYVLVYAKSPRFQMPRMVREKAVDDYCWTVEMLAPGEPVSGRTSTGWSSVRRTKPSSRWSASGAPSGKRPPPAGFMSSICSPWRGSIPPGPCSRWRASETTRTATATSTCPRRGGRTGPTSRGCPPPPARPAGPIPIFWTSCRRTTASTGRGPCPSATAKSRRPSSPI